MSAPTLPAGGPSVAPATNATVLRPNTARASLVSSLLARTPLLPIVAAAVTVGAYSVLWDAPGLIYPLRPSIAALGIGWAVVAVLWPVLAVVGRRQLDVDRANPGAWNQLRSHFTQIEARHRFIAGQFAPAERSWSERLAF